MVIALCERVMCVQEPVIRVISGQSISLEARGTDSSMRINFFVSNHNNFPLMYYFLRFFKARTAHKVIGSKTVIVSINVLLIYTVKMSSGSLNVSAYAFDDSTRAFASIRVGVSSIEPIREVNYQGQITGSGIEEGCVPVNDVAYPPTREYAKLKFIIFKYVWENWGNERLIKTKEMLKEAFSDHLESLYDDLGKFALGWFKLFSNYKVIVELNIAITEANPILVEQRRLREARGPQRGRRGLVQVRVPNPAVARTNFESPHLSLSNLVNEQQPFDASVSFEPTATNSANSGSATDSNMNMGTDD